MKHEVHSGHFYQNVSVLLLYIDALYFDIYVAIPISLAS